LGTAAVKLLLAALAMQSVTLNPSAPLEPTGPWRVEYADAMCIVGRTFGTNDQQVILGFRPGPMSEHFRVAIYVPDKSKKVTRGKAEMIFDALPPVEAQYLRGPISIKGMNLIQIDTKRSEISALNSAKVFHIRAGDFNTTLALRNIAGAMKALAVCEKDLVIDWGMDPAVLDSIETPAFHRNVVMMFSTDDYPSSAIMKNEQGTAGVRYRIGVDGKVSDCRLVESSGSPTLDAQTCAIITKRVRYEPAKTKSGDPVPSIGFQRIRWEIPR
jgi:TonB family protein